MENVVIFFGHFELPNNNALAHRVKANAVALNALGYNSVLVGYSRSISDPDMQLKFDNGITYCLLPYPQSGTDWIKDHKNYRNIIDVVKRISPSNCKALIFNEVGASNMRGLIAIGRKYNIPVVYDAVDSFLYSWKNMRGIVKNIQKIMIDSIIKRKVYNLLCISEYLENKYVKLGKNVIVIPSLTFAADVRFNNLAHYIPSDKIKICYSGNPGRHGSKDRIDWCVEAFAQINKPNAELVIYGVSKEVFLEDFPNIALNDRIHFMGKKDNAECLNALANSDFCTFARVDNQITRAGFPTKFSESIALGIPVITTPSGDLPKYIENGQNGFCSAFCSFESYLEVFRSALELTKEQRERMHKKLWKLNQLDEKNWRGQFRTFLSSMGAEI